MAIRVDSSGAAIALAHQQAGVHLAIGRGDAAWDVTPVPPNSGDNALVSEIGRRAANSLFVLPSDTGEINVNGTRWTQSASPTRYLYLSTTFDNADAAGETIREFAAYVGTRIKNTVPPGTLFFTPAQMDATGQMLLLDRKLAVNKTIDLRDLLHFVVQF